MYSSRSPKKPLPYSKPIKPAEDNNTKAKSSSASINDKIIESPSVHHSPEKKKQANSTKFIENTQMSTISDHSSQETEDKNSKSSLKQPIDHITKFSFRQPELINYFQVELELVERLTEILSNESNFDVNQKDFSSIKNRFKTLVENYIKQSETSNEINEKKAAASQKSFEFKRDFQELKSDSAQIEKIDCMLCERIRYLFNGQNDNDTIFHNVKIIKEFVQEMTGNDSFDEAVENIKMKISESKKIKRKYDQIASEKEEIEKQLRKVEKQLQDTKNQFGEDKEICDKVKSFYLNRQIRSDFGFHVENDIDLSAKVRSIFNEVENNDAIVRTIESNKETVKDNELVSDLVTKLEELNVKYEREHKDKEFPFEEKTKEIEGLKTQLNDQKTTIQNLLDVIVNIKRSFDVRIAIMEEEKKYLLSSSNLMKK